MFIVGAIQLMDGALLSFSESACHVIGCGSLGMCGNGLLIERGLQWARWAFNTNNSDAMDGATNSEVCIQEAAKEESLTLHTPLLVSFAKSSSAGGALPQTTFHLSPLLSKNPGPKPHSWSPRPRERAAKDDKLAA